MEKLGHNEFTVENGIAPLPHLNNQAPRQKTVAIDLDGVFFDFHGYAFQRIAEKFQGYDVQHLEHHDVKDQYPEIDDFVTSVALDPETYRNSPVIAGFADLCALIHELDILPYFLTARVSECHRATVERVLMETEKLGKKAVDLSIYSFGSTDKKAAFILDNEIDYVFEDNPRLHWILDAHGFRRENMFLVAQTWNRKCRYPMVVPRMTYQEIATELKRLESS